MADKHQVLLVLPLLKKEQNYPFTDIRIKIRKALASILKRNKNPLPQVKKKKGMLKLKVKVPEFTFEVQEELEKE